MFDIGFWELSLIGVVALLVIGPERLPTVARTVGKYVGRVNRFIANVKDDINKELKNEDLQRVLAEQQKLAEQFKNSVNDADNSVKELLDFEQNQSTSNKQDNMQDAVSPDQNIDSDNSLEPNNSLKSDDSHELGDSHEPNASSVEPNHDGHESDSDHKANKDSSTADTETLANTNLDQSRPIDTEKT